MPYTEEEKAESLRRSREALAMADELLRNRRDPNSVIIPYTPKPKPPPIEPRLSVVEQMAQDTSEQLDEFQKYISDELCSLLTTTFTRTSDAFDEVHEILNLQRRGIENDITSLQSEVATLKSEQATLHSLVEHLVAAVGQLRDQIESIDRSAGGKVVTLR